MSPSESETDTHIVRKSLSNCINPEHKYTQIALEEVDGTMGFSYAYMQFK